MIDHLSLPVSDVDATCRTWTKALAPLGYSVLMRFTKEQIPQLPYAQTAGLGAKGKPDVWLRPARQQVDYNHVAFVAQTRAEVDAFHKAALEVGMTDDGAPGLRQHYHPNYYGAFVRDADGHSLGIGGALLKTGSLTGVGIGGAVLVATGDVTGVTASAVTIATKNLIGIHPAAVSITGGNMVGAQLSVANFAGGDVRGTQLGVVNVAGGTFGGLQGSVLNIAAGEAWGAQVGVLNIGGDVTGTQIGVVNIAKSVSGTQIGVVNIAQTSDAPIGLLNIITRGNLHLAAWTNETSVVNVAVKAGGRNVYSFLMGGLNPRGANGRINLSYGLGIGVRARFGRWYGELEGSFEDLHQPGLAWQSSVFSTGARLNVGFQLFERMAVFAGPQFHTHIAINTMQEVRTLSPWGFDVSDRVKLVPGFVLGAQFL